MSAATVLIVDDQPHKEADEIAEDIASAGDVLADAVHPGELSRAQIEEADLILVDYKLDDWLMERDAGEEEGSPAGELIAQQPRNGLALAAVIRSQLPLDDGVRGIALLSANLTDLVQDFTRAATEHTAARFSGVEWAFDKEEIEGLPDLADRILSFAAALRTLNEQWAKVEEEETDRERALFQLLELGDAPWAEIAGRDVHAAQAPINQYGTASHGLSVLRWLGQRVLPYPTFLLDSRRLAMACGIAPEAIDDGDEMKALDSVFGEARYQGPLANFLGPRWWRAGVRHTVRELSGDTLPGPKVAAAVEAQAGTGLERLEPPGAVLGIDGSLNVVGTVARERALRIRPDDWPPFAETGWLSTEQLKKDPSLIDLIDPVDRERLGS